MLLSLVLSSLASSEAWHAPGVQHRATVSARRSVLRLSGGTAAVEHSVAAEQLFTVVPTTPFDGQKPGTSGLRKKTTVFQQPHYLENFVQSIFDALPAEELRGSTLVVSGDGRYHNKQAIQIICRLAAANGVARVWVGRDGLLSTPAASAVIREREGGSAYGGILLTASHNPGGPDNDFGIKYNVANGGPALESLTDAVYELTKKISSYKLCADLPEIDLAQLGRHTFTDSAGAPFFEVEVIDPVEDYVALLRQVFDFDAIRTLLARPDMSFAMDGMAGVAGPYARALFVDELGLPPSCLIKCEPSEDFEGGHPDPNLVYADGLVARMGLNSDGSVGSAAAVEAAPVLGAAADGDADRNMILGRGFFVTPSDSLAVIAAHAHLLPWFAREGGVKALARSMPTSGAVDRVAEALGLPLFETPTGWKFFGNLMDSDLLGGALLAPLLCGEESFGTGSSHVREKDGLWAVLCWMSILAHHNSGADGALGAADGSGALVGVGDVVRAHWRRFGRNFYTRYDYEEVDAAAAKQLVAHIAELGAKYSADGMAPDRPLEVAPGFGLTTIDQFQYEDPVDGSTSSNQGARVLFADGSRVVVRLSGTGSVGATVRIYIERYQPPDDEAALGAETAAALAPLVELALEMTKVAEFTGRDKPTVIT